MTKYKNISIILFILILLSVFALQFTTIQIISARLTASVYVLVKHSQMDLRYQKIEYSSKFGSYSVWYKDKEGISYSFQISSKRMPFFVLTDPIKPGN